MSIQKSKIAYLSPSTKTVLFRVEYAITASTNQNATIEDYEAEDLFD